MTEKKSTQLFKRQGLSATELADIAKLGQLCNDYEQLHIKIELDWLQVGSPDTVNGFLYYQNTELVGFLGLYGTSSEPELTGMVKPEFRRKGIFRQLLNEAIQECHRRDTKQLLLVTERASGGGTAFAQANGCQYKFSEYRMEFHGRNVPQFQSQLILEQATPADVPTLAQIHAASFNEAVDEALELKMLQEEGGRSFLAKLAGLTVGKVGVAKDGNGIYIRGVAILPQYQGRGYGRQMLASLMQKMLTENYSPLILDVQTSNSNALSLYQSCGFQETTVYDYYQVPLT